MRWFRHDCDAHRNPDLVAVGLTFGGKGLGWWWTLVELAASEFDADKEGAGEVAEFRSNTGEVDLKVMAHYLFAQGQEQELAGFLDYLAGRKLIDPIAWKEGHTVRIPRVSMYVDDTQRLKMRRKERELPLESRRETSRNLDSEKETDTEQEKNTDTGGDVRRQFSELFDELWEGYPSKTGRKQSKRHFDASVRSMDDVVAIRTALANYLKSERVANGFVQNGSTWFNNWRDWIVDPEPHRRGDGMDRSIESFLKGGANGSK